MPDSVGHHCYFISQPTKALQLKKGLNFKINNINKISTDCNDCGTLYVFWLLNYIYKLLNFLKTRTLIPSKQNRESQKKIFPQNTSYRNNRSSPQKGKKDTWSQVTIHQKWVPVSVVERLVFSVWTNTQFSLFISAEWQKSLLNKATHDTSDLHNHTFPEQPPRKKKSGPEILEIR